MTWPLAANLRIAAAHPADPYITAWIVDRVFHALTHQPARLFHAPIFHPLQYAFAFSENMIGVAALLAPLLAAKLPLLLVHNLAILLAFTTAGYGAALLGRHITGSTAAGIAGGVFFAFVPWRFTHLTHLQHLWTVWLPLLILAVLRLRERPTRGRAVVFVLCFVMNGLTNLHWLAFGSAAAVVCIVIAGVAERGQRTRFWRAAAVAVVAGGLLVAPLLYPYWRARQIYGMRGDAGETTHYSAHLSDWARVSLHNRLYAPRLGDPAVDPERWSFPGLLAPLLAIPGVFVLFRRSRAAALIGIALVVLGVAASIGLHGPLGRFLFEFVPLFKGIRVPARWSMITYLGLSILASGGALLLVQRRAATLFVTALLLLELRAAPLRWYLGTSEPSAVHAWLARQRFRGAVVELPLEQSSAYWYLFQQTVHRRPLINGVSGFAPPDYVAMEQAWRATPIPDTLLDTFRGRGAALVIIHRDRLGSRGGIVEEWVRRQVARGAVLPLQTAGVTTVYATPEASRELTRPPLTLQARERLEHPVHWEEITGALTVSGSAPAARRVVLHFDNHRQSYVAQVRGDRFTFEFAQRPNAVAADTDLQVEVFRGDGTRTLLPQVWLRWRKPGERLREMQMPQTADLGPYLVHPTHEDDLQRPRM